jgi:hypothetical protein
MNDPERRAWAMDQCRKPESETLVFEAVRATRVNTDRGPGCIRQVCRTKDGGGRIIGPVMVEIRLDCSSEEHDILIYRRHEDYSS